MNSDIETESFEWNDPMCSAEQLEFGECCAASVKFNIGIDSVPMQGKELTITITPSGGTAVSLGKFKVWSDVPTADRRWRTIEAYDAMADILNTECVSWYDGLFPVGTETYTVKQFRDSFFTFLGITQETVTLINDSETVARTISATSLSGKDVITAICQMNAVFGKIARDGKFKYVDLVTFGETLYPAEDLYPADDLYPAENTNVTELGTNGTYLSCEYEDYVTDFIDKVQIREQENDIGVIVGSGTNAFIIENNFLLFGKGSLVLTPIATAIYNHISGIYFKPAKMVTVGNPLMETGDGIRLWTKYAMIDTYILNRKMTGIQSLRDSIEAKSTKARAEELNDTNHELIQLIGKSNKLTRTIEEVESEIAQIETDLGDNYYTKTQTDSKIKQTADSIESTVSQSITQYDTETYTVTLYGFGAPDVTIYPPASHSGEYYLDNTSGKLYLSNGSAWSVVKTLKLITTEQGTQISQNTSDILLKVNKGEVSSEISAEAGQITISSNRLVINSTGFTLDAQGRATFGSEDTTNKLAILDVNDTGTYLIRAQKYKQWYGSSAEWRDSFSVDKDGIVKCQEIQFTNSYGLPYIGSDGMTIYGNSNVFGALLVNSLTTNGSNGNITIQGTGTSTFSGKIEAKKFAFKDSLGDSYFDGEFKVHTTAGTMTISPSEITSPYSSFVIKSSASSGGVILGPSSGRIGFFGHTVSAKQTVSKLSSSATLAQTVTKVNALLDALNGYGLIGI